MLLVLFFMKTIFITSFHTLISRNIISTDIIPLLVRKGYRAVVLVPDYKKFFFERTYPYEGVIYEGVDTGSGVRSRRVIVFKRFAEMMPNTRRAALGRERKLSGEKKSILSRVLFNVPASLIGKSNIAMRLFRFFDFYITPRGRFFQLFKKYNPDLIFSTDMQNEHDVALLQDAKKKGIKTVGMVRSWDNLTSRGIRIIPGRMIVHNEIIKEEAKCFHGINSDRVYPVGIPHYDKYLRGPVKTKEEFFISIGAPLNKKLIVYIPICDFRISHRVENDIDHYLVTLLSRLDVTILVRHAPTMAASIDNVQFPPNVIIDRPGYVFNPREMGDRDVTPEDDERLVHELSYCDLVVASPSTLVIDAAFFDKPIVMANFFPRAPAKGEKIYEYEVEHMQNVFKTGGVRVAKNQEEFLQFIQEGLLYSHREQNGRRRIVEEQCGTLDGKSCERIVHVLI